MTDKTATVGKVGNQESMTDSFSAKGRMLTEVTLEMFAGLMERLMDQEQLLQHVVKDITAIKEMSNLQPPFSHAAAAMPLPGPEIVEEGNMLKSASTHTSDSQQLDQAQFQRQRKEKQHVQIEAAREADAEEQPQSLDEEGNMLKSMSTRAAASEPLDVDDRFAAMSQELVMLRELCQENASRLDKLAKAAGGTNFLSPASRRCSGFTGRSLTANCGEMVLKREYVWQDSMWEASIFIGTGHTSWAETFTLSVCLLVNLLFSLLFIFYCQHSLISKTSPLSEEVRSELHQWQTSVAHDIAYRNRFTGESLASIVCKQKLYSPFATLQFNFVSDLTLYKGRAAGLAAGLSMCLLSLTLWYLTLLVEFRLILQKMRALLSLPLGPWTVFHVQSDGDSTRLVNISKMRLCGVALVEVVRFVVLACLGVVGTLWLVQELSLENMILNAVSLGVVLDLDELIFSSMVPASVQARMNALLPIGYAPAGEGLGNSLLQVLGSFGLLGASLVTVKFLMLDPYLDDIEASYIALCGETEQAWDFVVAIDSLGIPWVAPSTSVDFQRETFASWSVCQIIEAGGLKKTDHLTPTQRDNMGTFMQVFDDRALERQVKDKAEFKHPSAWTIIDPEFMPEIHGWDESKVLVGEDFGDAEHTVYNYYLRFLLNTSGYRTCADVPDELCYTLGGSAEAIVMRKLCGVRCGCDQPDAGTVSTPHSDPTSGFTGCASWHARTDVFVNELDRLSCLDTKDSLTFASWSEGLGKSKLGERVTNAWRNGGCYAVAAVKIGDATGSIMNVCSQTSLPAICPESCGCNTSVLWTSAHAKTMNFCPYACGRARRPCVTVYVDHGSKDTGPDGPLAGVACNFPYWYKGTKYETCTFEDWSGPWCGVTLAADGFTSKLWGDCPTDDACVGDEGIVLNKEPKLS